MKKLITRQYTLTRDDITKAVIKMLADADEPYPRRQEEIQLVPNDSATEFALVWVEEQD